MRTTEEIDLEIDHIEYVKKMLDQQLASVKEERDELREDTFIKQRPTKRLAEFFKAHGLYIVKVNTENRTKEHYELAKHIWRSKEILIPFIKSIPKCEETEVVYPTDGISKAGINSINNLCKLLTEKKWISFEKQEDGFKIKSTLTGAQKKFVQYSWSEEVNLYLLDKTLKDFTKTRKLKHKLFWNVQLKLIDTKVEKAVDMELDLVAQVGDRFYVFETKSGPILAIGKWVDRTRLFEDETNRFITCTANENLSQRIFKPCRLFALPTLEKQFNQMLKEDFLHLAQSQIKDKSMDQYYKTAENVTELLVENREWVQRYCDYPNDINSIRAEFKKAAKMFGKSPNLDSYTSVSTAKSTTKSKVYFDMRYNGQSVANLTVDIYDHTVSLAPKETNASSFLDYPEALHQKDPIDWNSDLASLFRKYFASSPKMIKPKNIEHRLESQLIKQFSLTKSEGKHLINIQPIKLLDKPFQMPTPLGACNAKTDEIKYSNGHGGGIDILARHGKGRGTYLTVIELKDECKSNERPQIAIKQAIAYATFIRFLLRNNDAGAADWWKLFGFNGPITKELKIKVVIAMPRGKYNDKSFAMQKLEFENSNDLLELHYIYFNVSDDRLYITGITDTSLA